MKAGLLMIIPFQKKRIDVSPQMRRGMDPFMFGHQHHSVPTKNLPSNLPGFLSTEFLQNPKLNNGIGGFAKALESLQQVLRMVETTTPLIKEYGPMIKNLPTMYRMMKAFKNFDDLSEDTEENKEEETILSPQDDKEDMKIPVKKSGISTPKLYI